MIAELSGNIPMMCFWLSAIISIFLVFLLKVPVYEEDESLTEMSDDKSEITALDVHNNPYMYTSNNSQRSLKIL